MDWKFDWENSITRSIVYGLILLIVVSLSIAVSLNEEPYPEINAGEGQDYCRVDGKIPQHTIILIDTTDQLPEFYATQVHNFITRIRNEIKVHEKITILHLKHAAKDDPENQKILQNKLSLCNPGRREELKGTDLPPRTAHNTFIRRFHLPIAEILKNLPNLPEAANTPLLESLTQISRRPDFGVNIPSRKLIIFSDFLQNANGVSHYCGKENCIASVKTLMHYGKSIADFSEVNVAMIYITREKEENTSAQESQTHSHRKFWENYFQEANAASANWLLNSTYPDIDKKHQDQTQKQKHHGFPITAPLKKMFTTSPYGVRIDPIAGGIETKLHAGVDLRFTSNTPIYVVADGRIKKIGQEYDNGYYENYVSVQHGDDYETLYAYRGKISADLREGRSIKQGDIIGYSGQTDSEDSSHLHFEVRHKGKPFNPCHLGLPRC